MTRLSMTIAALALLVGCSTSTATIDTQVLADITGVVSCVSGIVTALNAAKPGTVSATIVNELAAAQSLVTGLSSTTLAPVGASTLQTIDTDISDVLSVVGPIASVAIPGAGNAIAAIQVILPSVEAWVNPLITSATGVSAVAPVSPAALAAARKTLLIAVVK